MPSGMETSGASGRPRAMKSGRSAGETPTMVNGMPLILIAPPTTEPSVPYRRTRYWWLITATGSAESSSSWGLIIRPSSASTPNEE